MIIEVPWPRYPTETRTGRVSKSKKAGRRVPWLNMNTVNNLHRATHQQVKILWRTAAKEAGLDCLISECPNVGARLQIQVQLFAVARRRRDVSGVIEGVKPLIDGLVEAHVLEDDDPRHLVGFQVLDPVIVGRNGNAGVRLTISEARR